MKIKPSDRLHVSEWSDLADFEVLRGHVPFVSPVEDSQAGWLRLRSAYEEHATAFSTGLRVDNSVVTPNRYRSAESWDVSKYNLHKLPSAMRQLDYIETGSYRKGERAVLFAGAIMLDHEEKMVEGILFRSGQVIGALTVVEMTDFDHSILGTHEHIE